MNDSHSARTRRTMRGKVLVALCSLVALVAAGGCGSSGDSAGGTSAGGPHKIKLGYLQAAPALPVLVAEQQGIFKRNNLDVETTGLTNPGLGTQLLGRQLDIVPSTPPDFLLAAAQGRDIYAISGAYTVNGKTPASFLVVRNGITDVAGLRGKTLAVTTKSGGFYTGVVKMLREAGLAISDVKVTEAQPADAVAQLQAGQVDAVTVPSPYHAPLFAAGLKSIADPLTTVADPTVGGFWSSTKQWAGKNPEAVKAFTQSIKEASDYVQSHPEEADKLLVEQLRLPANLAASVVLPQWDVTLTAAQLQPWVDNMNAAGQFPSGKMPPPLDTLIGVVS